MSVLRKRVLPVKEESIIAIATIMVIIVSLLFDEEALIVTVWVMVTTCILIIAVTHRNRFAWFAILFALFFTAVLSFYLCVYEDALIIVGLLYLLMVAVFIRKDVRLLYKVYLRTLFILTSCLVIVTIFNKM